MSATPDPSHRPRPQKRQRLDSFKNPQLRSSPPLPQTQQNENPSAKTCQNPSCKSLDIGEEDGIVICQQCGTVVNEMNIVSELQFAETSAGGHVAMGSYVGNDQAHASSGITGLRHGGSSSREMTESNGKSFPGLIASKCCLEFGRKTLYPSNRGRLDHASEPYRFRVQCLQARSCEQLHPRSDDKECGSLCSLYCLSFEGT